MSSELDKLKKVLTAKFKPKITEIDASTVKCNDGTFFSKFDGATLLVIGTEKTNLAYNCMPFVTQLESSDSAFIEVNPWDGRNYAIIVNTADSKVLQMFTAFIETEKFKKATSKSLWFIEIGIDTAGYLSLLCTGALVPCDTIVDAASTDFYCAMKGDVVLCAVSAAMMAVPYIPAAPVKQAVKSVVKDAGVFAARVIKDAGEEFVHLVSRAFKRGKLDDLTTLLKAMGKCTFSASGFNIQSGCPGADDFAKLLKSRSRTTVDKAMDAAYTDHELMHRIVRASKENIPDEKFARMLDSELVVNGKNLKNFEPVGDKIRIGTVTDKSGTTYYFKRDQVGVISLTDSNDRERIAYRLNYLLDESDTTVKVPKSRRIKDVSVDGELETGLLTEEIEGTDLMTLYENKKKDWGGGLDGQTKFFKYTKEISDTQKDTMRKQMVRDFMFGANDRNLANAIATKDGKVAFIDFEQTFINNGKISVIFDTPSTVNAMLSNKLDENLLRNYPQYIDLMEKWNWDNPSVQKEILDLLEPEVKKLEKLTAADFEAALQFEKLKGSSVDMQNVKKEIFGTTGNNGRLHDFIKDFKKVKAEVEAKLK